MTRAHPRRGDDPRSTAELVEVALIDPDGDPHGESHLALLALMDRGSRDVLDAAIALCGSDKAAHRRVAATLLGQLGPDRPFSEDCCDALLHLLKRECDSQVLVTAVFAFGHLGNRRCEPELIALKDHPNDVVRHGVAFSLHGATSDAAVRTLLEMTDDPYVLARDWATTSLGDTLAVDGPEIRAALLRRASDEDEIIRSEAQHGLARRHDERVVPYLIAELSADRDYMHLFVDAAKDYLGVDQDREAGPDILLSALQSGRDCL